MVLRGKTGDLVKINALFDDMHRNFFSEFKLQKPHLEVLCGKTKKIITICHGEIVMMLESSVPPWYPTDRIRCLWGEKEIFVLRTALEQPVENNDH